MLIGIRLVTPFMYLSYLASQKFNFIKIQKTSSKIFSQVISILREKPIVSYSEA